MLKPEPTPEDELLQANRRTFQSVKATMDIVLTENRKQILRGNEIDAMLEYQGFIQRRLAALLNLKYRPAKHDFGIRYGQREYPPDVAERVKRLIYPGSPAGIGPRFEEAAAWAVELMRELEESWEADHSPSVPCVLIRTRWMVTPSATPRRSPLSHQALMKKTPVTDMVSHRNTMVMAL